MKVRVMRKHINKGVCSDSEFCPIALALKEKTHKTVEVGGSEDITINGVQYRGPMYINTFIKNFDDGNLLDIGPFSFELSLI
jgi:hypothetical protein